METKVSPFANFAVMQPKALPPRVSCPQVQYPTIKTEACKSPFGKKQKIIKMAAVAATLGLVVAGIVSAYKNHEGTRLQKQSLALRAEAREALDTASEIQDIAERAYRKATSFIQNGIDNGFKDVVDEENRIIRKFQLSENGIPNLLEEFGENGELLRKTKISPSDTSTFIPQKIEEFIAGTEKRNVYIYKPNAMLQSATFGVTYDKKVLTSIEKGFVYQEDGTCAQYFTNFKHNPNRNISKYGKRIIYGEGVIDSAEINKKNGVTQTLFNYEKEKINRVKLIKKGEEIIYYPNEEGLLVTDLNT